MRNTKEKIIKAGKIALFGIACTGAGAITGAVFMKRVKDKEIEATKEVYEFEFENIDEEANTLTAKVDELEETIETYKTREEEYLEQIKELESPKNTEELMKDACRICMEARSLNG